MTSTRDRIRWPLGAQARPWMLAAGGPPGFTPDKLGEAMRQIREMGFTGFEANLACLPLDDPKLFSELRAAAQSIELCGGHTGGRWWDESGAQTVDELVSRAPGLRELGAQRLVISMQKPPPDISEQHLNSLGKNLTRLGWRCRTEADIHIAVHNHAAELANDAAILDAIVHRCSPEDVSLGADLGWVAYVGADLIAFIERFGSRLSYLHLRDVDEEPERGFVEVGRGVLNYPAIFQALAHANYDGWLVVESDAGADWHGYDDPVQTTRAQLDGLRRFLPPVTR